MRCGGGVNHRTSLSDQALVKDNHVLAAGGVVPAYQAVLAALPRLPVQVEVTTLDQLRELLDGRRDQILLDNMTTEQMAEAVRITAGRAALEASGGLTVDRAREVAATGVDFLAVGGLTHSAPVLDIAMDLRRQRDDRPAAAPTSATATPRSGSSTAARCVDHWRVATDERRTADEWGVLLRGLLALRRRRAGPTGVAVCSTVPGGAARVARRCWPTTTPTCPHVVVEPGVRTGVPVLMDNPREVGSDRIVNALAAAHLYDGPSIVVDFGTATTFDVVSPAGEYVGGAIAPGIEISLEALGRRGAQLRKVELLRPRSVIAKNTVEALQSGVLYGFASPGRRDGRADDRRARARAAAR